MRAFITAVAAAPAGSSKPATAAGGAGGGASGAGAKCVNQVAVWNLAGDTIKSNPPLCASGWQKGQRRSHFMLSSRFLNDHYSDLSPNHFAPC